MSVGRYPSSSPKKRKAIIVLDQFNIEKCRYEPEGANLLVNDEIYILEYPIKESDAVSDDIANIQELSPNQIFIQNPYSYNEYELVEHSIQSFALKKFTYFSMFCSFLGAKTVKIERVESKINDSIFSIDINAGIPKIATGLNGRYENKSIEKFVAQLSLKDEYTGGTPDITAAETFLNSKGLQKEVSMSTLLEICKIGNNRLKSRNVSLDVTRETQHNMSIVAQLDIPIFLNFGTNLSYVKKQKEEYKLSIIIDF